MRETIFLSYTHTNAKIADMIDNNNNIVTSHSVSPVPCIVTDKNIKLKNGRLCDVAPTLLNIMGIEIPSEMTGESLIERN